MPRKNSRKSTGFKSYFSQKKYTADFAVKEFYRKILSMQEEERKRISRDLHDEAGQIVIALGSAFNVMEQALKEGNIKKTLFMVDKNRKMVQDIANKLKFMVLSLRPPALDILGLSATLREFFSQCTKSNPIKIEFKENIKDVKLNENIEITLYRIVQEAITNIIKHSEASRVKVGLFLADKKLKLDVEDNGKGFDMNDHMSSQDFSKMGLRGIQERVDILGGYLTVDSKTQKGTKLSISFPCEV